MHMWRTHAIRCLCSCGIVIAVSGMHGSSQVNHPSAERQPNPGIYIPPNEQHPAVALPIFNKSNHGVYVSVGTERSFLGAALTGAEGLYVIDYDPGAVRFANINRALLAASSSRTDYLYLRLSAPLYVWRKRSKGLSDVDRKTLANPDSWKFWNEKIRKNLTAWDGALGHFHTEPTQPNDPFFASNYLFDDRLYDHLSRLAKRLRIWSRVLDLRHTHEIRALCVVLKSKGLYLGVVDTSDVPNGTGDGASIAAQYVRVFSEYGRPDTLFLNTAPAGGGGVRWSYYAFSNRVIQGHDQITIQRWYEIEMKKIYANRQLTASLDDPDAISH